MVGLVLKDPNNTFIVLKNEFYKCTEQEWEKIHLSTP